MNRKTHTNAMASASDPRNMFILLRTEILLRSELTGIEYPPKKTIAPCMTVFTAINSRA
jgi:hypothetical protein